MQRLKTIIQHMKPVCLLVLVMTMTTFALPAMAQSPVIPPTLPPAPAVAQSPVDIPLTPVEGIVSSTQDLSFTLTPPDPSTIPPATPLIIGPLSLDLPAQARITNLAANVTTRLDALTQRFEQISDRLKARIDIEKAAGRNTATAEAAWADSVATLVNVKNRLASMDSQVQDMVTSADSYAAWGELKINYLDTSSQLRRVQENLMRAVESLQ